MPITINGSGTVTGIIAGGLPDGCIVTADIADDNVTTSKIADDNVTTSKIADNNVTPAKLAQPLTLETAQSATGTEVDFTDIPSWVKRVTVMFAGVSTNGTADLLIQLGDAGGVETTGYLGASTAAGSTVNTNLFTSGFGLISNSAANISHGSFIITLLSGNTWTCHGLIARSNSTNTMLTGGSKALSDTLDRVRITTSNGTNTFDAGTINIMYE
jgi:hypothetical protein